MLLETCHARSVELLRRNLSPAGILAATPGKRADLRGYTAIFGRDAAVCALGMAVSGDAVLEREAATGLHTLAAHQAPNGQIPKFVDLQRREADFWYLGCIDSTLWWLIALAFLDSRAPKRGGGLRVRYASGIRLAVQWLLAQEHQRFFLLQQNEASDWADIMPRSGFVLYTNALWYFVKRLYGLEHAPETLQNFNGLFHPFSAGLAEYRRARLLNDYVLRSTRRPERSGGNPEKRQRRDAGQHDLYLSFVNFAFFGEEGDVFGNVLAVLLGLADARAARRTLDAVERSRAHDPYPLRAVTRPIKRASTLWRPYMARHRQNLAWQYHNGGIWPMVGGFWVTALVANGRRSQARGELVKLARACALKNWAFTEWLHGKTLAPRGMPGQSWNAAAYLMAERAVEHGPDAFFTTIR
ncbi:MAG TPA: glycoside hydrolase 100 family protein [Chthoniobacteraceae bacterium]|nr:glycoside hydrolase 100 family protein [Chthoniobacteraceae bacterium]